MEFIRMKLKEKEEEGLRSKKEDKKGNRIRMRKVICREEKKKMAEKK